MDFIKYLATILLAAVCVVALAVVPAGALAYFVAQSECAAAWGESGAESKFSALGGCLIKLDDGRWVPSSAVRWMDLTGKEAK